MLYFILVYLVLYFILARIRFDWAVLLLIATLPTYLIRFQVFGIPFTLLEGMILVSFFVWFFWHTNFKRFLAGKYSLKDFKANHLKRRKYPFGIEIILLLIISFFAVGVAGFSNEALGAWKAYFFEPILVFILILNVLKYNSNASNKNSNASNSARIHLISKEKVVWVLAISALFISLFAIFQKFTGLFIFNEFWQTEATRRVTSFFPYPNAVGLYLGPIVMIFIGYLFFELKNKKEKIKYKKFLFYIFYFLVISLSVLSIYFAKSEGALIGVLAGLIVFGLLANKKTAIATIIGIIVVSASMYFYLPTRQFAYEKITLMDHSGQIRRAQWAETWDMLKDGKWFLGSGLANYQNAIAPYHVEGIFIKDIFDPDYQRKVLFNEDFHKQAWQPLEIYLYPHNIFLNFWVELGFFGALLFVWIIAKYFYFAIKNYAMECKKDFSRKYLTLGLICSMVAIVTHGLVDVPYFKNDLSALFWILVALIAFFRLEYTKEELKNDYAKNNR